MTKKILLLAVILVAAVTLQRSSPVPLTFVDTPLATAHWEVSSRYNNNIGTVIRATLIITTEPGVTVDWSRLPLPGQMLQLPAKPDPNQVPISSGNEFALPKTIDEGELEVVSRSEVQYFQNDLVITEIDYEFQYLLPLDLSTSPDDKLMPETLIYQKYLIVKDGTITWDRDRIVAVSTDFYIKARVDGNSEPVFKFFEATPPIMHWSRFRIAGFGFVGLGTCLFVWYGISLIKIRKQVIQTVIENPPDIVQLYRQWHDDPDYQIFIETLILYRRGTWGKIRPLTLAKSTFYLYSGLIPGPERIESVFAQIIKEVEDEHSV